MGKLVVSIDFEMRWGVLDIVGHDIEKYKDNLLSVHENIPWMLKVFKERNIAATWATVGAVGCSDWSEFDRIKPKLEPSYQNKKMIYNNEFNREIDPKGELYFAPELIHMILETPNQELGMHTFGHIYATESDVSYEELHTDLLVCKTFFSEKFRYKPDCLVFPRNQIIYEQKLLEDNIITSYRGNEPVEYLSADKQREQQFFNRLKILVDAINPYSTHAYMLDTVSDGNIPSSAMLRIYLSHWLRQIHLNKLKKNLLNLKVNEVYHTWFHPHNLGHSQKRKDDFIRFFDFVADQVSIGKLQSENMGSLFSKVNA